LYNYLLNNLDLIYKDFDSEKLIKHPDFKKSYLEKPLVFNICNYISHCLGV